jgi:predicted transcriptional regulator
MGKRSRLEIQMDIIAALSENSKSPTRLMQLTNLQWGSLQECLRILIANGIVIEWKKSTNRKFYSLTPKGSAVIQKYREFTREIIPLPIASGRSGPVQLEQEIQASG